MLAAEHIYADRVLALLRPVREIIWTDDPRRCLATNDLGLR